MVLNFQQEGRQVTVRQGSKKLPACGRVKELPSIWRSWLLVKRNRTCFQKEDVSHGRAAME
jgi:hypothetical protein